MQSGRRFDMSVLKGQYSGRRRNGSLGRIMNKAIRLRFLSVQFFFWFGQKTKYIGLVFFGSVKNLKPSVRF